MIFKLTKIEKENVVGLIFKSSEEGTVFLKMGQSRPLFVYFRSFRILIYVTNIQFELYKLKKV